MNYPGYGPPPGVGYPSMIPSSPYGPPGLPPANPSATAYTGPRPMAGIPPYPPAPSFPVGYVPPNGPAGIAGRPGYPVMPPMPGRNPNEDRMQAKMIEAGLTNKITNVWVGKISPVVEDDTVKKLLETCGIVSSWARVEKDGQLKTFGFCKFATAEGALRSLRLLDGVLLGDDNLQLKVDQKTRDELADYERKKKEFIVKEEAGMFPTLHDSEFDNFL